MSRPALRLKSVDQFHVRFPKHCCDDINSLIGDQTVCKEGVHLRGLQLKGMCIKVRAQGNPVMMVMVRDEGRQKLFESRRSRSLLCFHVINSKTWLRVYLITRAAATDKRQWVQMLAAHQAKLASPAPLTSKTQP